MARSGHSISAWVSASARVDDYFDLDLLAGDRTPEFPTVADECVYDEPSHEALQVPKQSEASLSAFPCVVLGLAGLLAPCTIYPFVSWFVFVVGGGNSVDFWPIVIGVSATLSLVLAFLADRRVPGRVALLLIAVAPLAVAVVVPAILGGNS